MRLLELKILGEEIGGLSSSILEFGEDVTQLFGPNGCGKTPVIHSIAFALGFPVKFRDDITERCHSVSLLVEHNGVRATFNRAYKEKFDLQVSFGRSEEVKTFYDEKRFSEFFFSFIGLDYCALISNSGSPAFPYISTFLPLYYVDQDSGYARPYKAPSSFIRDQYVEMVRFALGIAPKNGYEDKKSLNEKKRELTFVDEQIVNERRVLDQRYIELENRQISIEQVDRLINSTVSQLDELRETRTSVDGIGELIAHQVMKKRNFLRDLEWEIQTVRNRISSMGRISKEIEEEIKTLRLSESAKYIFESFNEICANKDCGLFLGSAENYGKSLLYLKDQTKDLALHIADLEAQERHLVKSVKEIKQDIEGLEIDRQHAEDKSGARRLVVSIESLTRDLVDLQSLKTNIEKFVQSKNELDRLVARRKSIQDRISSMDNGRDDTDIGILAFKSEFKEKVIDWLDVLKTKNVSREIVFEQDLDMVFGGERITQFSGSTLIRLVLAVKAAFFEVLLARGAKGIEFIIFDTPRQQDMEEVHFAEFLKKLKLLVSQNGAQLVFSTTEYHYKIDSRDKEWIPEFPGDEHLMFLGENQE